MTQGEDDLDRFPGLDREYLAALRECLADTSQREVWRRFNEICERLDIEEALEMTPEERLLQVFGGSSQP